MLASVSVWLSGNIWLYGRKGINLTLNWKKKVSFPLVNQIHRYALIKEKDQSAFKEEIKEVFFSIMEIVRLHNFRLGYFYRKTCEWEKEWANSIFFKKEV